MNAADVPGLLRLLQHPAEARRALAALARRSGGALAPELADLDALLALVSTDDDAALPREVRS